jgi:hypothetical protein
VKTKKENVTGTEENVVKGGDVHDLGTVNVIADIDQEVAKVVNVVDLSHPKISLDVEKYLSIGMFRLQVLNILHLFNIKPCKLLDKFLQIQCQIPLKQLSL